MFFELRQYRIFPGKRDEWVRFMEERIMPGQLARGVVIVGSFVGQQDDDVYVWIRRFDSEEHFAAFNENYYGSDEWKNELRPIVTTMLDFPSVVITRLEATPKSVIR
ncbi:MAG: NIPSNAP family protein [Chloroflexi bacterium]|nr:NIPSNAP family protein [Chloroflexota bacterium]